MCVVEEAPGAKKSEGDVTIRLSGNAEKEAAEDRANKKKLANQSIWIQLLHKGTTPRSLQVMNTVALVAIAVRLFFFK